MVDDAMDTGGGGSEQKAEGEGAGAGGVTRGKTPEMVETLYKAQVAEAEKTRKKKTRKKKKKDDDTESVVSTLTADNLAEHQKGERGKRKEKAKGDGEASSRASGGRYLKSNRWQSIDSRTVVISANLYASELAWSLSLCELGAD